MWLSPRLPSRPEPADVTIIRARFRPHPRGFGFLTPVAPDHATPTTFRVPDDASEHDSAFVPPQVASGMLADDLVDAEVAADDKGVSAASVTLVERSRRMVVGTVQHGPGGIVVEPDPSLGSGWLPLAESVAQRLPTSIGRQVVVLVGEQDGQTLGRALVAGPHVVGSPQAVRAAAVVVALGRGAPTLVPGGPEAVGLDRAATVATHTRVVGLLAGGGRGAAAGLDSAGPVPGAELQAVERRDEPCVTIDDPSARDLDDALGASWDGDADQPVRVAVHIADAAAGVGLGSPADDYAKTVASSAYFIVGDSAPMLDPVLSEGALSLLPGEDRSAISVRFAVLPDGAVEDVHVEFCWITPRARLSYSAVDAFLGGDPIPAGDQAGAHAEPVRGLLESVAEAARRLGVERDGRDTMEGLFETTEVDPALVDGKLATVPAEPHAEGYRLVERLMVAANEAVAGWLVLHEIPALYRAHAGLDPDRAERIRAAAQQAGAELPALEEGSEREVERGSERDSVIADVLAEVARLEAAGQQADRDMLVAAVTGATVRATYDPDPAHHKGLASSAYTHFTSPLRRYADLVVHRQIRAALANETPPYTSDDLARLAPWLDARAGAVNFAQARERGDLWSLLLDRGYLDGAEEAVVTGLNPAGLKIRLPRLGLNGFVQAARALDLPPRDRASLTVDEHGLTTTSGPWRLGSRIKVRFVTLDDTGRPVFRLDQ